MAQRMPKQPISQAAKWFDRQPLPRVVVTGALLGLGLGLFCFGYLRALAGLLFWGVLFVALWRVGHHAEPVFEDGQYIPAKPQRVRDGPLVMMELPGGTFRMTYDGKKPQRTVTIASFRIGVTPVTTELYRELMQQEPPSEDQRCLPIVDVSWEDAIRFCNALCEREGYQPCYRQVNGEWSCDGSGDGYRLPTEAEWEYACRAGTETSYWFGDDPEMLDKYAWFSGNSGNQVHEVRGKVPNPWGLYDMHGNVWEWCWDQYKLYSLTRVRSWDDLHQYVKPKYRVLRGGSFISPPEVLRSASRGKLEPVGRNANAGFRCVRVPPSPS
jgi:formylglycine-generating enzyme required for sulfatase activity